MYISYFLLNVIIKYCYKKIIHKITYIIILIMVIKIERQYSHKKTENEK